MGEKDPYSRLEYRRLIAWPPRIEREWPLLERVLRSGPSARILDLGSGTGEHACFLASKGFEVVGVDRSPTMTESATSSPIPDSVTFVEGDLRSLDRHVHGPFGGSICLGNTLPHLTTDEDLHAFSSSLRTVLLEGAPLLIQVLGYDRIVATGARALPVNVRPGSDGEEIVFVRLMTPREDGSVLFYPTTLSLRDGRDPPIEVMRSRRVELRAWRSAELGEAFAKSGFAVEESLGGFDGKAYDPSTSSDLVLVVRAA